MNDDLASTGPELSDRSPGRGTGLFIVVVLLGAALSVTLGVYGHEHTPTGRAIITFGFPTLLGMKAWLATGALALGVVQGLTALRMYGRIGRGPTVRAVTITHRVSGVAAVLLTLPVAFHCLWSLGFGSYSTRVLVHSLMGCAFYGVFLTKMLAVRSRRLPPWALPVLGGVLFTVLVTIWLTSSLWFFTGGPPHY
ncbi:MAG TPA: DUF6529 family protein [Dermatophilaceae bacterium]